MLALYATLVRAELSIYAVILLFGTFISGSMVMVIRRHNANQAKGDSLHLIGLEKH
jgi:hypothetical protein